MRAHVRLIALSVALAVALAGACSSAPVRAGTPLVLAPYWLELIGVLPAPTYDPYQSQIPRRRPGHAYEPLPVPVIRNPDGIDPAPVNLAGDFLPVPDRWRIMESNGVDYPWYDPYNQNTLKGDKPIRGNDHFLSLELVSDTLLEPRSIPTPVAPQAGGNSGELDALGRIHQVIFAQTVLASASYYIGDTTFKPPEAEFRTALAFNYNRVNTQEVRTLQVDPRRGTDRDDGFIGVQELWFDKHLRNVSTRYDFDSLRIGIQPFSTDFRGFLFQDSQPGVRLFGNRDNNRWQYNLAWFRRLEKDLNSGLNDITRAPRRDDILIANLYRQDWPYKGFTSQAIVAWNHNRDRPIYDSNGFIQRPASLGLEVPRTYDVGYLGYNGDGHLGRINLSVAGYAAFGHQSPGVFVPGRTQVRAGFLAAEASMDFDWVRVRGSLAYASGDRDPYDDRSTGFDAIFENPIFAGADTSYWIGQNVPLIGGGGVTLSGANGLLPNLRSSREMGQSNFDNPGLRLVGIGADFDLTPQSRLSANANALWFDHTAVLEAARNQGGLGRRIGSDLSAAWIWRPFMTQNAVVRLSAATLLPGSGFKSLYGDEHNAYYAVLANLILTY